MKRLISLMFAVLLGIAAYAQERTVSEITLSRDIEGRYYSYYNYDGGSSDVLIPTTRDTIDIPFDTRKSNAYDVALISTFNPLLLADTTVIVELFGRNSTSEDWTSIVSGTSDAVTADGVDLSLSSYSSYDQQVTIDTTLTSGALAADAFYVSNVVYSNVRYRLLKARYIISGDDSTGTGIEIANCELKLFLK